MKVVLGFLLLCAFLAVVVLTVVVDLLIKLLPILLIAAVIVTIVHVRSRHGRRLHPRGLTPPGGQRARNALGSRAGHVNATATQGDWVFIPVWVPSTPRPARPYVDAEVIEDDRSG
jgi:hypothetical protein